MRQNERQRASRTAGLILVAAMVGFIAGLSGLPEGPTLLHAAPDGPAEPTDGPTVAAMRDDADAIDATTEATATDATATEVTATGASSVEATVAESRVPEPPAAAGRVPAHLLRLPEAVETALIFDLLDNRMYLYEHVDGRLTKVADTFVAVGKNGIDKMREGDEKTPVGIYFPSRFIPDERLPAIYGAGAFPITYPNTWDRILGRTGSGIWIHGTDKQGDDLLPQSSRGCLTLHNDDFLELARHIELERTPVIVSRTATWASPATIERELEALAGAIETWRVDWESRDTDRYLRHYSPSFRTKDMDFAAWSKHKRRVNARKSFIEVGLSEMGLYRYPGEPELFMATFRQDYRSSNYNAERVKHQFWRRENGEWRIVHEGNP